MTSGEPIEKKRRRRGRKSNENNDSGKIQDHKSLLIKFGEEASTWYDYGRNLPDRNATIYSDPQQSGHQSNNDLVAKYRAQGDSVYQKEIQLAGKNASRDSDNRWVESTMKKGTLKDRIAATSVTVSTSPLHKFYALDGLLSMAGCAESGGKSNSRVAQLSAEALEDVFTNTLLPPDRKLLTLSQRPLYLFESSKAGKKSKKSLSPRILLLWRFEEMVKEKYDLFLRKYMAHTLQEGAEMHKIATLHSAGALLASVPEGESQLLAMIVNKLGDPGKKTAAAAGHQLRLILQKHPNMQMIIAREVQQLTHRPHLSSKALYNCIVFLNQLKLEKEDDKTSQSRMTDNLPSSLIKTYFRLFEVATKSNKKGLKDKDSDDKGTKSRLLSALLTGVNRAHPYLPSKDQDMEEHIDALYRIVHTASPAASTQALMLLFHLIVGSKATSDDDKMPTTDTATNRQDRFYRALFMVLSKPSLVSHGKHLTMFFNLLYKAMKYDPDTNRVNACAKRFMSTAVHSNPATIAGSLFLLNEITKTHPGLQTCMEEVPNESNAKLIFDDSKREPRAALVIASQGDNKQSKEIYGNDRKCPPSWELSLVSHHFHPSVSKFGGTIGEITYSGDPLRDFGLAPFLDKFAYRNPKSRDKVDSHFKRGKSVAERRSGTESQIQTRLELPVNDPAFLERESVSEQDEFFLKFFTERARRDEIKGIMRKSDQELDGDDDIEDAEVEALDAAEEADDIDIGKQFEEYEQAWETDEEEEAFADSLAEKLMETEAGTSQADLDDEDPDMDDWSDNGEGEPQDDSDEDDMMAAFEDGIDPSDDDSANAIKAPDGSYSDEDDFMDAISSDSDSDGQESQDDFDLPTFADAEEYERLGHENWAKLKRSSEDIEDEGTQKRKKQAKKSKKSH